jgi:hypothetical protein
MCDFPRGAPGYEPSLAIGRRDRRAQRLKVASAIAAEIVEIEAGCGRHQNKGS